MSTRPEDYEDAPLFEKIRHRIQVRTEAKHERENQRDRARRIKELLKQGGLK